MSDTDTATRPAGKRQRAAQPIDTKAFLTMLTDARKLVAAFQRALKQVSPRMSMRDYMTLARLGAGEAGAEAGAGAQPPGDAAGRQPKARKAALGALEQAGLVSTAADRRPQVTEQGRKVLAEMDAMLSSVVGSMGGRRGAATKAGGRNLPLAVKAVKRTARAAAGGGQAGGTGPRRARRQGAEAAAAGADTLAP